MLCTLLSGTEIVLLNHVEKCTEYDATNNSITEEVGYLSKFTFFI